MAEDPHARIQPIPIDHMTDDMTERTPTDIFLTFDGVDSTGKSTQIDLTVGWLRELGHRVVTCRDPGTTKLGETLRQIVLESVDTNIDPRSETLIYMAARAQLVHEIIRPALAEGAIVVSDRFLLANVVYQGYGFSLPPAELWRVGEFATDHLRPTKTVLLDMDVTAAKNRRQGVADRMERRDRSYFQRLREGFLTEARLQPDQIVVVDADRAVAAVQADIRKILQPLVDCST